MSRHLNTVYNKKKRVLSALKDSYRAIRSYHGTQVQLSDRLNKRVYETHDFQTLPRYAKEYIRGYERCLFDTLLDDMTYCRVWCDLPMTPKEIREHKKDWTFDDWEWLGSLPQGMFWSDTRQPFGDIS